MGGHWSAPRPGAVVLPGHLATLGCNSSSKDGSGPQGGGERAGRRGRGWGWQEEGRGEKGNRYHLTFNLSLKKNLCENYIDPFLITLCHCSLLERGLRCLHMYFINTSPSPHFRVDHIAFFPSPSLSHLGWTQSYASLAKGVFLN